MRHSLAATILPFLLLSATPLPADDAPAAPGPRDRAFVLIDVKSGERKEIHAEQAAKRFTPASTFKIPHALIALETGVVKDQDEVAPWDGTDQPYDSWEKDQTLGSAIRNSVVWYFQGTARKIGAQRMAQWLRELGYGNQDISAGIDTFWLGKSLEISPREQAEFLARLWTEDLPFDRKHMETVRSLLLWPKDQVLELAPDWPADVPLSAKTGNARLPQTDGSERRVSWLVGHVLVGGRDHVFASVVVGPGPMDRYEGARAAVDGLRDLGLIPRRAGAQR